MSNSLTDSASGRSSDQLATERAAHVLPKDADGTAAKTAFTPSGTATNHAYNGSGGAVTYHALNANSTHIRLLTDDTTNFPYIAFKTSAAGTPTANDIHVKHNLIPEIIQIPASQTHIAIRSATATGGNLNIVEM